MRVRRLLAYLGKLFVCGITFFMGMIVGSKVATGMGLQPPALPAGAEMNEVVLYSLLTTPILALALALLARGVGSGLLTRTLILSFFTWIAYTVNTQLDASLYMAHYTGFWYSVVAFFVASLLCGTAVAFLFPPVEKVQGFVVACKAFFGRRRGGEWLWRLATAAVAFAPIYYFFGLLVFPFTGQYYQDNMYGLQMAGLDQILPVLFLRSVLFLLACLPIIVTWQRSRHSLFIRLGLALFTLVGLLYMLAAYWMPLSVRLPHSLEMLADEFVYAAVLVILLASGHAAPRAHRILCEGSGTE